jgi:hypothetical protein
MELLSPTEYHKLTEPVKKVTINNLFARWVIEGHIPGKVYAYHTCCALIGHCIENGLEPVWACKLENNASFRLAQKLGFVRCAEIPDYRLGLG